MSEEGKTRIGIMGGTFDPVHYGHLYIAECARFKFGLDKVLFVPSGQPVHKRRPDILTPERRAEMVRLAVSSNPYFELSTIEVDRPGPSYAVDTLGLLHSSRGAQDYYFITGADAILEILTWKDMARLFALCRFIAVTRPGYSLELLDAVLQKLTPEQRSRIYIHETSGILVSSTDIRRRVAEGEPVKYLLPENVEDYIRRNGLYTK